MTENQEKQVTNLLNRCVNGIQKLETNVSELKSDVSELKSDVSVLKSDVSEIKSDVSELKDGQKRIEKEMRLNNRAVNKIAGEQVRMDERLLDLEKASV